MSALSSPPLPPPPSFRGAPSTNATAAWQQPGSGRGRTPPRGWLLLGELLPPGWQRGQGGGHRWGCPGRWRSQRAPLGGPRPGSAARAQAHRCQPASQPRRGCCQAARRDSSSRGRRFLGEIPAAAAAPVKKQDNFARLQGTIIACPPLAAMTTPAPSLARPRLPPPVWILPGCEQVLATGGRQG